ncbi:DUF427 domain-containing protein [Saccharopolyspora sp. HNM0983]|uniref:DUF427 domain-containing protein n=1 Tax=Saccharopolyspora montiporae TaxID=2781240 RepID=A0A929BCY6_9PSEU|nr:DUF427 domain-containing protein [Saccharopolyspora sp. HNM0983]MBE9375318.1 DUF427 domain-containing protein [Saccharopolyspora sp. HNM0983]
MDDTGQVRVEGSAKRVRAHLAGQVVADSRNPLLVWEHPYYPTYYLPAESVRAQLEPTGATQRVPGMGGGTVCDVSVRGATAPGAAVRFEAPSGGRDPLVRLEWAAMQQWFEEDEPVYTHPRDPYKRVDVLASSRHVVVRAEDVVVADSVRPHVLHETGLPPRYYLPQTDVRTDLLRPSDTRTHCPYKGAATYWDLVVDGAEHRDAAWCYRTPLPESQKIAGLVCFYDERIDLSVDGMPQEHPRS